MPIVFLDFDGVLHPEHCHESKHFSCLPVFESVLSQVTDCKLVIASTWGLQIPVERLRDVPPTLVIDPAGIIHEAA